MIQRKTGRTLGVSFTCPTTIAVGDVVRMNGDNTVKKIDAVNSVDVVGTVINHAENATTCVVDTKFRTRRDDRVAAADAAVGPFVWDSAGKAVAYTQATFGTMTGTADEPFLPVTGATDTIKCKEEGQSSETFVLAPTDTTAALVATKINATALHVVAEAVGGYVRIRSATLNKDLIVESVTHDDYTELGFTAQTYTAAAASHDPGAIMGMVIKSPEHASVTGTMCEPFAIENGVSDAFKVTVEGESAETFDITADTDRTAAEVAADINATALHFIASDDGGHLKLTALEVDHDIDITTVSNNAYTVLGFTVGTTTAPLLTIETLEY